MLSLQNQGVGRVHAARLLPRVATKYAADNRQSPGAKDLHIATIAAFFKFQCILLARI